MRSWFSRSSYSVVQSWAYHPAWTEQSHHQRNWAHHLIYRVRTIHRQGRLQWERICPWRLLGAFLLSFYKIFYLPDGHTGAPFSSIRWGKHLKSVDVALFKKEIGRFACSLFVAFQLLSSSLIRSSMLLGDREFQRVLGKQMRWRFLFIEARCPRTGWGIALSPRSSTLHWFAACSECCCICAPLKERLRPRWNPYSPPWSPPQWMSGEYCL